LVKRFTAIILLTLIPFCCGLGGLADLIQGQLATPLPGETSSTQAAEDLLPEVQRAEMIYYTVTGSTESELSREIREKGPQGYAGYTSWRVSWSWPGYGSLFCDVSGVDVDAAVTVTFPSWEPPADASLELVEKWARFVAALAVHEQGHVDNVYENLPRIQEAIQSADCLSAEDAAQEIIAEMNQYDLDYDTETGYGRTQGAVFP
jgi:predicted secreted Zn-dependent protease